MIIVLALLAIGLATLLVLQSVRLHINKKRYLSRLHELQRRLVELERDIPSIRWDLSLREDELKFLTRCLKEFSYLVKKLHSQTEPRLVPSLLLKIVLRMFEPKRATIFLRRKRAESDPGRENRLVVAATFPNESMLKTGTEVSIDEGDIGFVAQTQRSMSRADFLSGETLEMKRGFVEKNPLVGRFDLISPMVVNDETVGLIALSGLDTPMDSAKTILHLVSQIGSVAVQNVLAYHSMKRTADMDGLTRLFAKQYMTVTLGECVYESQQESSVFSIFLFDIDNFKNYNDTNGHVAGDKLLQQLAILVTENTRQNNIVGRVGGEEFLVIFPDTDKTQALKIADNLRSKISSFPFLNAERQPLGFVSISGGVACYPQDSLDSAELTRQADQALYRAKEAGRNRVFQAEPTYCGGEDGEALPLIFETLSKDIEGLD